jgi:predicted Zn-dependent protease
MKKTFIQGLIIIAFFLATWFAFQQVNWISVFKVQKITDKTEEKLGELFWDVFKKSGKENKDPLVLNSIDSLLSKICSANNIDREFIKLHILRKDDINAFALPDGHLVIYTGLILNSENQEELCGVIGHEIAHIELNHVSKKLVKEIGLSALISMTTGNTGAETIKHAAKILSSSAFDRGIEKEADIKAVDYLINAKINPEPFAEFLYKLSIGDNGATKYLNWISTHPESKERAEYIIEYGKDKKANYESILTNNTWKKLKDNLKE